MFIATFYEVHSNFMHFIGSARKTHQAKKCLKICALPELNWGKKIIIIKKKKNQESCIMSQLAVGVCWQHLHPTRTYSDFLVSVQALPFLANIRESCSPAHLQLKLINWVSHNQNAYSVHVTETYSRMRSSKYSFHSYF